MCGKQAGWSDSVKSDARELGVFRDWRRTRDGGRREQEITEGETAVCGGEEKEGTKKRENPPEEAGKFFVVWEGGFDG